MYIPELVNEAILMLNHPENEYEVRDLLYRITSDVICDDDSGLTPMGQIYHQLREIDEDLIAKNIVLPLYRQEIQALKNFKEE